MRTGSDSDGDANGEDFLVYGRPFPAIEDIHEDKNQFQPVWKQEVTDEKGRRRLHGAFTGGFSAGYFNTVGSAEGWAPSSFRSSRSNRQSSAPVKQMRPEDFMDEEDLADLKRSTTIAQIDKPQEIRDKRDAFHSQASQSATLALPKTLLNDLIGPSTESKGTQLLFAIGWREGKFTESSPFIPPVKQDQTGLGYRQKYQSLQTIAPTPKETFAKTGGSRLIQGRGFGIGAFEDEDDDIDVYDDNGRTASLFSRTIVDEPAATAEQPAACKQQESAVGGLKDFRPASSQRSIRIIQYEPPRVPQSFVPRFQRLTPLPSIGRSQQQQQKDFGPQQRGALLGERPLPKQRPTVASNPSLSSQQPPPPHYHSKFIPSSERRDDTGPSEIIVEQLEPGQALAALSGFIPFPNDPLRQERYKAFLKAAAKVSPLSTYQTLLPKSWSERDEAKERAEFVRAALLFQPLTGAMANRFQSSKSSTVNTAAQSQSGGITDPSQLPTNQNQQPSQTTANTTVDLSISREIKPWQPHRMLCKRFNIAPPAVSVPVVTTDGSSSTVPGPSQVEDYLGPTVMKQLITDHQQSSLIKQQQQTIDPHMETLVKEEAAEQQNATERQHKHEERDGSIVALPSNPDQIAEDNRLQRLISLGGVTAIAEERIKAHESDTIGERPTMDIFRALFAADDDEEVESEQDQKNVSADATVPTTQTEMVVNLEQPSDFKRPLLVSPPSNSSSDGEWVEKRRSPSVVHSEQSSRSSRSRHRHHRHRRHRQRDSKRDRQDKDGEPKQQHKKHKRRHRSQSSSGRRERSHRKRSKSRERHHDSSDKQRRKERDERSRHRQDNNPNDRRRRHGDFPAQQPASGNDNKQQRERPSAIDFF